VADLAKVGAVGGELEELGGAGSVSWTGGVAAGEDEDVSLGVDGDAGGFAEKEVGRELDEIRDGVEGNFGDGLAVSEGCGDTERKSEGKAFHNGLLSGDAALLL